MTTQQNIRTAEFMGGFDAIMAELQSLIARHAATLTPTEAAKAKSERQKMADALSGKSGGVEAYFKERGFTTTKDLPATPAVKSSGSSIADSFINLNQAWYKAGRR